MCWHGEVVVLLTENGGRERRLSNRKPSLLKRRKMALALKSEGRKKTSWAAEEMPLLREKNEKSRLAG